MQKKQDGLFAKSLLFMILFSFLVFQYTISYMKHADLLPTLLPLKTVTVFLGVYGSFLVFFTILSLCKKRFVKTKKGAAFFLFVLAIVIFIVAFLLSQNYDSQSFLERLAAVNSIKRKGLLTNDVGLMLAYYAEGLLAIAPTTTLRVLYPIVIYIPVVLELYILTKTLWGNDIKKCETMFVIEAVIVLCGSFKYCFAEMVIPLLVLELGILVYKQIRKKEICLLCIAEVFLILIFIFTFDSQSFSQMKSMEIGNFKDMAPLVILLVVALIYLYEKKNEYFGLLAGYSLLMWILSVFIWNSHNLLMMSVVPICAYAFTQFLGDGTDRLRFVGGFLVVSVLFLCAGFQMNHAAQMKKTGNIVIPEEYEKIIAVLPDDGDVKVLAQDELLTFIRLQHLEVDMLYEPFWITGEAADEYYDAAVRVAHDNMENPSGKLGGIVKTMEGNQCNYLVLPLSSDERWEMEQGDFVALEETEHFVVYCKRDSK